MPRAQQVSLPQTQGLNKSGSLSDSVLLERPSPFQGSSSETGDYDVEVDLYLHPLQIPRMKVIKVG